MSATFKRLVFSKLTTWWQLVTASGGLTSHSVPTQLPSSKPEQPAEFTSGTGDNQVDKLFEGAGSTATSVNVDLAGSFTHPIDGSTVTAVEIAYVEIWNTTAKGGGDLVIGNGTNPFLLFGSGAHTLSVKPGGGVRIYAPYDGGGYAVTAGTGDILKLAASSGTVSYEYVIAGRSA